MTFLRGARVFFAVLFVFVTYMTLTPNPDDTKTEIDIARWIAMMLFGDGSFADKVAHFVAYGSLGAAAALAQIRIAGRASLAIVALALYGALLEGMQGLGGVRTPDLFDGFANAAGAGVGYPAMAVLMSLIAARARA